MTQGRPQYRKHLYAAVINNNLILPAIFARHYLHVRPSRGHEYRITVTENQKSRSAGGGDPGTHQKHQLALVEMQCGEVAALTMSHFELSVLSAVTTILVEYQTHDAVISVGHILEKLRLDGSGQNYERARIAIGKIYRIGCVFWRERMSDSAPHPVITGGKYSAVSDTAYRFTIKPPYLLLLNKTKVANYRLETLVSIRRSRSNSAMVLFMYYAGESNRPNKISTSKLSSKFNYLLPHGDTAIRKGLLLLRKLGFLITSRLKRQSFGKKVREAVRTPGSDLLFFRRPKTAKYLFVFSDSGSSAIKQIHKPRVFRLDQRLRKAFRLLVSQVPPDPATHG